MNQMKKRGLSIRYKILLLLTIVPLLTLALYLALAVQVFENDKIAYVFESSSAVARTMSAQATTDLNATLNSAKPIVQEFLLQGSFGPVSKSIFDTNESLQWVAAFSKNPTGNEFTREAVISGFSGIGERDLQSFGDLHSLIAESQSKGRVLRVPFKDDRILIVERVPNSNTGEKIFFIFAKLENLASSFRTPSSAEVYLINDQGFVLFGPLEDEAKYLTEKMGPEFLGHVKDQKFATGTEQIKSTQGHDLLASYAKSGFGNLTVVSLIEKKEALKAVQVLIRKSLVFFVLLICVTTIVSLFASGTLTSALTDLFAATRQVAEGHFDIRVAVKTSDEIGSLADSFNAMAGEVSRLVVETAEKSRMESELKTAQTVQETLFPPTEANLQGFQIAGYYEPASECGGDWWHYCQVDSKIFLWIGDATGHGAPAALITSAAKSAATIIERLNVDPAHALGLLNRAIYDVSKGRIMMTFFLACFDLETKEFSYANASHEAPFLIKQSEEPLKKKNLIPLNEVNNPRLGQSRETTYEQTSITLNLNDRILFYTDGIPDIQDPQKKAWGEREFIKAIIAATKDYPSVAESVKQMTELFKAHRQGAPLVDDITFFMCQYTRSET